MKLHVVACIAICIFFYIWCGVNSHYAYYTDVRMRRKIYKMDQDLCRDSIQQVQRIIWIRDKFKKSQGFQISEIVYDVRKYYVRMMFIYHKALSVLDTEEPHEHLKTLVEIQSLALHIEHLINAMEEFEDKDTRKKRITRMGKRTEGEKGVEQSMESKIWKQRAYMIRTKIEKSLAHGASRDDLKFNNFRVKHKVEDGFDSDVM